MQFKKKHVNIFRFVYNKALRCNNVHVCYKHTTMLMKRHGAKLYIKKAQSLACLIPCVNFSTYLILIRSTPSVFKYMAFRSIFVPKLLRSIKK
jgi:hypothetical protein